MLAAEDQKFNALSCKIEIPGQFGKAFMRCQEILMGITALGHHKITQIIKGSCLLQIKIQIGRITLDIEGHIADGIRTNGRALAKTGGAVKTKTDHVQAARLRSGGRSGGSIETFGWI